MNEAARDREVARQTVRPRSECPHCSPGAAPSDPRAADYLPAGTKLPDLTALGYLRDRHGVVWRLVRDGGMVTSVGYDGTVYSAGTEWLERFQGPLEQL